MARRYQSIFLRNCLIFKAGWVETQCIASLQNLPYKIVFNQPSGTYFSSFMNTDSKNSGLPLVSNASG